MAVMVGDGHYLVNPEWAYRGTFRHFDLIRQEYLEVLVRNRVANAGT